MEIIVNRAASTLSAPVGDSDTSLTVADASTFPNTGNFRLVIDNEILLATGVDGDLFTVSRGEEGTAAASHASGASISCDLTVASLGNVILQLSDALGAAAAAQAASDPLGSATTALATAEAYTDSSIADVTLTSLAGSAPTGTGGVVLADSPTFVTPVLGTPTSGNLANCSGYPPGNLTGVITSVGLTTSIASQTGTGSKFVVDTSPTINSPTLVTPALGTPASGNLENCTGYPVPSGANPSASVGLAAVNGSAATFLRSDGAPALSQAIAPTWTGVHSYQTASPNLSGVNASGMNAAGGNLLIAGGKGTGTGAGGGIFFQVTIPESSGSSLNSLSTLIQINSSLGRVDFTGLSASQPVVRITGASSRAAALLSLFNSNSDSMGNVGGCKFDHFATVSTTSTNGTFDTLYSDTTVANTLSKNGDKIVFDYSGTIVSSATATRELILKFAGIAIFDSGALTFTSSGTWRIEGYVIRVTSTTALSVVTLTQTGSAAAQVQQQLTPTTTLTGLTLTTTNVLALTAAATGTGAASGDISATSGTISNIPFGS